MGSDSDLEAYLNQLSRKTYDLKVNEEGGQETPSSNCSEGLSLLSDAEDAGPAILEPCESDVAALSKKYGSLSSRKTQPYDRLSTLEHKYLGKQLGSTKKKPDVVSFRQPVAETKPKKLSSEIYSGKKSGGRQVDGSSSSSSQDPDLSQYEMGMLLMGRETDVSSVSDIHSKASESSEEDTKDEILNFENILTVQDIFGEILDGDSVSGQVTGVAEEYVRTDVEMAKREKTVPHAQEPSDKSQRKSGILLTSNKSVFHANVRAEEERDNQPVGLLLAQVPQNVFHSSRRKSIVEFDEEELSKFKLSKQKLKSGEKSKPERTVDCTSSASVVSTADNSVVSEKSEVSSMSAAADKAGTAGSSLTTPQEQVGNNTSEEQKVQQSKKSWTAQASTKAVAASYMKHCSLPSPQPDPHSRTSPMASQCIPQPDCHIKTSATDVHSPCQYCTRNTKGIANKKCDRKCVVLECGQRGAPECRTSHMCSRATWVGVGSSCHHSQHSCPCVPVHGVMKCDACCHHPQPCSPDLRCEGHHHHPQPQPPYQRCEGHHHHQPHPTDLKYEGSCYHSQPYPPGLGCEGCCLHSSWTLSSIAGAGSEQSAKCGLGQGARQLMQQQVVLTRQFLESQRVMYQAYSAALTSSHRYTSLASTEQYIKRNRKPTLSFAEAYKVVEEEMKASS